MAIVRHAANRQANRPVALGEPTPAGVGQQAMMRVARRRPIHQRLQQPVQIGGGLEVGPTGHQGHALPRVVMRHAEMVARWRVLAGQHHVAEARRIAPHIALAGLGIRERPGHAGKRRRHVEPERVWRAGGDAPGALARR